MPNKIDREMDRIYQRSVVGYIGMTVVQRIFDYIFDPRNVRERHHRQAMKDLEDMRF